jgi:diguanylate cyclase (GGDEF)-like protein/PAS domain S-box-containing protein
MIEGTGQSAEPVRMRRAPPWRLLAIFAVVVASLLGLGLLLHRQSQHAAEVASLESLNSTVRLSTHGLDLWIAERYADADVIANNPLLTDVLGRWLADPQGGRPNAAAVQGHLEDVRARYDYRAIAIIDGESATVLAATGRPLSGEEAGHAFHAAASARAQWVEIPPPSDRTLRAGVARRLDASGPLSHLVLYLELRPAKFVATLKEALPRNWGGETLLLRREPGHAAILSPNGPPVLQTLAVAPGMRATQPVEVALAGADTSHLRGQNRQGVQVLAMGDALSIPNWYLVSMIDEATVYAPLRRQTQIALAVMTVLLLLGAAALLAWYRGEGYRQALREEGVRRYYEDILLHAADMFVLSDAQGKIVQASDSAFRIYGYTRDQMLGLNIRQMVPPERLPAIQELVRGMKPGETRQFRDERWRADGSSFVHEGNIGLVEIEGKRYYHTTGRDVTQQDQVETRLRIAASFFEHSAAAIVISDLERRILMVNPQFTAITGFSSDDVLGKHTRMLSGDVAFDDSPEKVESLDKQGHWEGEVMGRRKNGEIYPRRLLVSVFRNEAGQVVQHVSIFTDLTRLKQAESQAEYLAHHDRLTGLPNRAQLDRALPSLMEQGLGQVAAVTVALLNIDRFQNVNESLGHAQGDALLCAMAVRLRKLFPDVGHLYRYGGDEFMLVMVGNPVTQALLLSQVRAAIAQPVELGSHSIAPTASIGVASFPEHADNADALLRNVSAAMRMAKSQGRNTWRLYEPEMNASVYDDMLMAVELRHAIDLGELQLYLQPQFRIADGTLVGMEALLRWKHITRGMVSPARFIPLAESSGLIVDLSAWVLREACRLWSGWRDEGLQPPAIAVNLSALQFQHPEFLQEVAQAVADFHLPPHALEMELTESLIMDGTEAAIATMHKLVEMGIQLAIDDFGTGYSSLSYLRRFPVGKLKIDRSFVLDMGKDGNKEGAVIATAVIGMAKNLNLKVIAEGVETVEQCDFLREHGCDEVQGYLFSKPLPAVDLVNLLRARAGQAEVG